MNFSYKKVAGTVIAITLIFNVLLILLFYRNKSQNEVKYVLKDYNENVALFKDDEVITVYDGIVLTSLPYSDIQRFIEGIKVESPEEAETIIENYDG